MLALMRNRAGVSWLILVAATLASFALGADHGTGSLIAVAVLAIAAIKVRLVGLDFMELRHAPIPLRAAFEVYCVGLWALLSGLYLWL
jgi:Prokaryotic Cytochrome C oxidase subunit IV